MYPYVRGVSYDRTQCASSSTGKEGEGEEGEEEGDYEEENDYESLSDVGGNPERERELDEEEKKLQGLDSIYQWMPAEFDIEPDGEVHIASYINNLDRQQHADLYDDIARVFRLFLPLFGTVSVLPN
jgi:hypothetical protein